MATKDELVAIASETATDANKATKAFEDLRKSGSAEDLVKAAHTVTTATRAHVKAQHERDTFELVAVYERIRAAVLPLVGKFDMATMQKHDVATVTITVPVGDGPVEADKLVVNTLGKRTVTKATGNGGSRTRYVYGPDKLNSREVVEREGANEVGAERAEATLAEPSKFGLTPLADRIAGKLGWDKTPA